MIRTQISLELDQYRALRARADEEGRSMAAIVREAVDDKLHDREARREDVKRQALSVIGTGHGGRGKDVSEDHDRYLDEAYGDW